MIRYLVGNRHVGDSYLSVVRYVLSHMVGRRRAFFKLSKGQRRKLIRQIIREHRANRRLYAAVMGANLRSTPLAESIWGRV